MSSPYFRFNNGVLSMRGARRVQYSEPVVVPGKIEPVQTVTIPVIPEPVPEPAPAPEPSPAPEPVPEPEASNVEAPLEVTEAPVESGLVPEDPPA